MSVSHAVGPPSTTLAQQWNDIGWRLMFAGLVKFKTHQRERKRDYARDVGREDSRDNRLSTHQRDDWRDVRRNI